MLASLAPSYANASRAEESNAWRNPVDLIAILEETFEQLNAALADGQAARDAHGKAGVDFGIDIAGAVLSDNQKDIVCAMLDALRHRLSMERLAAHERHPDATP